LFLIAVKTVGKKLDNYNVVLILIVELLILIAITIRHKDIKTTFLIIGGDNG